MQPTLFFKCRPSARTCVRHCGTRTSTAPLETDFYEKLRQLLVCVLLETQVGPRCFQHIFFRVADVQADQLRTQFLPWYVQSGIPL